MKYSKKEMTIMLILCFVAIFAIFVVEKLIRINVSPDVLLKAEAKKPENIVLKGLGDKPVSFTFSENTSHILAVKVDKKTHEKTYELITPGRIYDVSEFDDGKKVQNLLMQIVSGSSDANAGRCVPGQTPSDCSGTHLDGTSYVESKCWCK
ncbi:MAG: hypothetical protein DU489_12235 [Nitrosomonas sp.]|uniref:hypothetical protein n=1 Tax=Nitrosomonas sp. TaxID=42353 RepID=UPI0032EB8DF9